jgi:hypothetical protein
MVHMLSAEWGWLDRCGGAARGAALSATDYPTLGSLLDRWRQVESSMREFLSTLPTRTSAGLWSSQLAAAPDRRCPWGT